MLWRCIRALKNTSENRKRLLLITPLFLMLVLSGCRSRILEFPLAEERPPIVTPAPTPTPEATPEPTPEPSQPPEPSPEATPEVSPEATPEPTSVPDPADTKTDLPPDENGQTVILSDDPNAQEITDTITVTLDPNGGACGKSSVEVTPGGAYGKLPDASRKGYHFAGWYFKRNGGSQVTPDLIVSTTAAHTLYAHWSKEESCTLTLDPNGGRLLNSQSKRDIFPGETYGVLPTPLKEGSDFLGWFTAPSGGKQIADTDVFSGSADQILYAQWHYDPYAYWSYVLQNTTQQVYACQQVSVYLEYGDDHITPAYSALISSTGSFNVATNRGGGEVDDEWVLEKNPNVIVKVSDDPAALSAMQARFPGRRILLVPSAAEFGSAAQQLYYRIAFGKLLYPDWYANVDLAQVGAELGVSGAIYGG